MKVTEHIKQGGSNPMISFEILPPTKGKSINSIYEVLDPLMEFKPAFVNVTYHRSEQIFKRRSDGSFDRVDVRKRPGTVGICAAIMNHYKVDAVPHLICGGFSKDETENALIDLNFLGVKNVLVLRGDPPKGEQYFRPHPHGHNYAIDLVKQVVELNKGKYIEEDIIAGDQTDFCIGVAGYPEKHFESANPMLDIMHLKEKVDAGAEYITTQMFFDNSKYENFVTRCREADIHVPIIPGLKPLTSKRQLSRIPSVFHVDLPEELTEAMLAAKTKEAEEQVGQDWLLHQSKELLKMGAPALHYYTLGKPHVIHNVMKELM
jgi:methylenetetrahydrofolate reductase (NADPH)